MEMLLLFDLPGTALARITEIAPDARVQRMSGKDPDLPEAVRRAEVILGWPDPKLLESATRLRWLQIGSAGANRFVEAMPDGAVLTNASGVFGVPIAEHLIAMLLALTRGVPAMVEGKRQRQWRVPAQRTEIAGRTCGILGTGDIGRETARRLRAMNVRVRGVNRSGDCPDAFDDVVPVSELDAVLPQCDILISTLPGTPHTHHLLSRVRLALLPQGALVLNVGRGSTIDETALVEELRTGRLGGAALDVFETEPLPETSPLWDLENVLISPHCSGATPHHAARLAEIFLDNLQRFVAGKPLRNVVDPHWGY